MGRRIFLLISAFVFVHAPSAMAQRDDELARFCADPHPQVRLLACKVIIEEGHATGRALADAYASRGTAYFITGDAPHAIEDFDHALMLDPDRVLVLGYRGSAHLDQGDYDRAIADFGRAVQLEPDYVDAFYGRASALRAKGENDGAIADYGRVIALDPTYVEAFVYRGMSYRAKGEVERATADFEQALKLDPNDATARDELNRLR